LASDRKSDTILLKLSGEAFSSNGKAISQTGLHYIVNEIIPVINLGIKVGVVVGGGNIIRGGKSFEYRREYLDYAGMIATIVNGIILKEAFIAEGINAHHFSGIPIEGFIENFTGEKKSYPVLIFSGGTGRPFFTTDTAAVLRALQMKADLLIKGTKVDGIFNKNPEEHADAKFFKNITYEEAIEKKLGIMDLSAFSLAMNFRIPIKVINFFKKGNFLKSITDDSIGTTVK